MRLPLVLLAFFLLSTIAVPTHAQDGDGCDIDLTAMITTLIEAQRAADSGDDFAAVQRLERVRAELDALIAACEGVTVPLGRMFTSPDGLFRFSYPEGWAFTSPERGSFALANNQMVLNAALDGGFSDLESGAQVIGVVQADFGILGSGVQTFADLVQNIEEEGLGDGIELIRRGPLTINGYEAVEFTLRSEDVSGRLVAFNFATDDNQVAVVFGLAPGNEFEALAPTLDAVVKSVEYGETFTIEGAALDDLDYINAVPITDYDSDVNPRVMALAPDGETVAWLDRSAGDAICLLSLERAGSNCTPMPLPIAPPMLFWSPDSRFVAFTQNFFITFNEPDIWVFDTENLTYTNLTEDNSESPLLRPPEEGEPLPLYDHTLTWGRDGNLYFIRQRPTSADDGPMDGRTELYRVNPVEGEPELIRDLTGEIPALSVYHVVQEYDLSGGMAVSLDSEQIAMAVFGPDSSAPENGIWVMDLSGDDAPQQVMRAHDLIIGMPAYLQEESTRLNITGMAWGADNESLYLRATAPQFITVPAIVYHLDLTDNTLTPLVDYSDIEEERDLFEEDDNGQVGEYIVPDGVVMAPDYSGVLMLHMLPRQQLLRLVAVTPDGEHMTLYEGDVNTVLPTAVSTVASDGTALMWGYLFQPAGE